MDERTARDLQPVPWIAYEAMQTRASIRDEQHHKTVRWLIIVIVIILVTALVMLAIVHERDMEKIEANNKAWIDYLQQYDFADYEYVQDGKGVNVMGNGNGVEIHGSESASEDQNSTEPEPGPR